MERPALQPEQSTDLPPRRHRKHGARRDEEHKHHPEARARTPRPLPVLDTRAAAGPMELVGASDGIRIGRRRLVGHERARGPLPCRLAYVFDHPGSIRPRRPHGVSDILSREMVTRERRFDPGLFGLGDGLGLVSGVVLAVSSFTGWYTGEGEGVTISVLGWHTGVLGKLVLFVGLAVVLVLVLRELGIEPPAALPQSLVTVALGALATVFVLVRVISVPDDFFFANRGVGLWISLAAAIAVIVSGLIQASEEL